MMMFVFVMFALVFSDQQCPHEHAHPLSFYPTPKTKFRYADDFPKLTVTPAHLSENSAIATVAWENIGFGGKTDYIAVYSGVENKTLDTWGAPVKFKVICDTIECGHYGPASSGNLTFELINRRDNYQFVYFGGSAPYFEFKAISDLIYFANPNIPMHVHIAAGRNFGNGYTQMYIMWVQNDPKNPEVRWGYSQSDLDQQFEIELISEIKRDDYCDHNGPGGPAFNQGYSQLGKMITATIVVQNGAKEIFYQVGEEEYGWSDITKFYSPKEKNEPTTFLAFGDMGKAPADGAQEQSWDNHNHGELGALDTMSSIENLLEKDDQSFDFLLHFGDISYSTGYLCEWDEYMHMIRPVAERVPYMAGIGNHEFGYSESFWPSTDSGGECGVPYNFYFSYASQDLYSDFHDKKPWYSFDYGNVHVIQISSEHNITVGSDQYNFLENDLKKVNREDTPWVVLTAHRPLYIDSSWDGDKNMSDYLTSNIEHLMIDYSVNLGLYGHYHAYQRSCPAEFGECKETEDAPIHLVLGMAGYSLTHSAPKKAASWAVYRNDQNYGYARITLYNETVGKLEFLNSSLSQEVLDSVTFENYYSTLDKKEQNLNEPRELS